MGVTLRDLQKALSGEIGMSNELDDVANALFVVCCLIDSVIY